VLRVLLALQALSLHNYWTTIGLARTTCIQCIYGIFGRESPYIRSGNHQIYGVQIYDARVWPTLDNFHIPRHTHRHVIHARLQHFSQVAVLVKAPHVSCTAGLNLRRVSRLVLLRALAYETVRTDCPE